MKIEAGKFVALQYDLFVGEENEVELMEQATAEAPLQFIYGMGQMLDTFETHIANMSVGDSFDFTIPCEEAYGEYDDEHILDLQKEIFEVEGEFDTEAIYPGAIVPMMDNTGNRINGSVVEIVDDIIKMDFNHPLAGENLHFVGKVLEVRMPKPEELMPQGGCGCSCEDCGSSCDSKGDCSSEGGCGCN